MAKDKLMSSKTLGLNEPKTPYCLRAARLRGSSMSSGYQQPHRVSSDSLEKHIDTYKNI